MWIQIAIMIISIIIQIATRPRPQTPPSATLNDVNIPTIDQGTPVAVAFGEVWVDSWMVLWYGDLSNQPIKKSAKGK